MAVDHTASLTAAQSSWRFKVGIGLFATMILLWLLIPIEIAVGMSAGTIAATTAGIAVTNKIILLIAIAVMGKAGFQELKGRVVGHVRGMAPASIVSPPRYMLGLVLFFLPLFAGFFETWASHITPAWVANRLWVDLLMDAMLIASFFVLGGNFWDKIRALFVREARAVFPSDPGSAQTPA